MKSQQQLSQSLYTVKQFTDSHAWCSYGGLRSQILHQDSNGLRKSGAIIRSGRKILIDETRYIDWLRSNSASTEILPPRGKK